jgi:phosphatidylserine decarboxylase
MIAREGYALVAVALVLAVVLAAVGAQLGPVLRGVLFVLAVLVLAFTLYFFRDPRRIPPEQAAEGHLLLSPADGKVVVVERVEEPLYLRGPATQISIFLSPLNVHVNRVPADGVVEYVRYVPGDYLVAWHPKASEKNERSELGVRHPGGTKVLFKQIAGAVARRIVFYLKEGDEVRAGQRFGIVKFGSRMDILVPPYVDVHVRVGDRVVGGITVLGVIPETVPAGDGAVSDALNQDVSA